MYGKPDYDPITDAHRCEICGRWYSALVRHIPAAHNISVMEYKIKWGINKNEPLMGESVREKLRHKAYATGVNKNLEAGRIFRFRPGSNTKQKYTRSEQTRRRLRVLRKLTRKKRRG
jgi:hypothetical protein